MKLFRRNAPAATPQQTGEPETVTASPSVEPVADSVTEPKTPEEALQLWFREQAGVGMPEVAMQLFRRMARAEAKRLKVGEHVLDAGELRRVQESLRLYQTKLTNAIHSLEGLVAQKEWLHRNEELKGILEKYRQAAFAAGKAYNSRLQDFRELERFEMFETVQGLYQSIRVKEAMLQQVRQSASEQARMLDEVQLAYKEARKVSDVAAKKQAEEQSVFWQRRQTFVQGSRIQAIQELCAGELKEYVCRRNELAATLEALRTKVGEVAAEQEKAAEDAAGLQQRRMNMEPQQRMLEKGELILERLKFLQLIKAHREDLRKQLETTQKRQQEQDEKLNRLFLTSQDLNAQIKTLQGELQVHVKSIVGMNSYKLQQRTIVLKSDRERIANAIHLWKQITEGYARVDEKNRELMQMKYQNDALKAQIERLATEVNGMRTQCDELQYSYTLSKSQDVMQLRKDLREGTSCSVCGATHHPYHSDTVVEQNKLVSGFKSEYEQVQSELKRKVPMLEELRKEQAMLEGRMEMAFDALDVYKRLLQENVGQWETYASLDRALRDCSPSTNMEGRRILLQQLLEKIGLDAEEAQKELDTFNFHQANINDINEKLAGKELEKGELAIRLNEVNTGSQVMAYRMEQLQQEYSQANEMFSRLYDEIDKGMALSNWYKVWEENPETLGIYLRQQMEQWFALKGELVESRVANTRLQVLAGQLKESVDRLVRAKGAIDEKVDQLSEFGRQLNEQYRKLVPDLDLDAFDKASHEALSLAEKNMKEAVADTEECFRQVRAQEGDCHRLDAVIKALEGQIAGERSELDVWIRKYNAVHSPVQFSELQQTLDGDTDWNAIRSDMRTLALENRLAEARVEDARMALAAHLVDAASYGVDGEARTAVLNAEIARLEAECDNIRTQIAGCRMRLQEHELGLQKQAAGTEDISLGTM